MDWVPGAAGRRQLGGDHLVEHGQVGLDAEDGRLEVDLAEEWYRRETGGS